MSIKFLFTDAAPSEVTYLMGAPVYEATIDAAGSGSSGRPVAQRTKRDVRLLQVDLAVKDKDAASTEWVFGTFGWVGPLTGDGLSDNLVPVSLQWSNDPKVYDTTIAGSWINPALQGVMYGWSKRPTLGFNGRANGPADNIRSSCLSCHAAARTPRSSRGLLGFGFDMETDINDATKVREHVDFWFDDLKGGDTFHSAEPAASALDYSLQLESAVFRICRACRNGDLTGTTPAICQKAKLYDQPTCQSQVIPLDAASATRRQLEDVAPPRQ